MINENKYLSKTTDTYIFIRDLSDFISEDFINKKSSTLRDNVIEIIKDPKLWTDKKSPPKDLIQTIASKTYNISAAKVRNYKKWVFGYGLVLICAIFDEFLIKLLEEILDQNPQFTKWSSKQEIIERFREGTIKEKYNVFINKLNFSSNEFFDFNIFFPKIKEKFSNINIIKLKEIYKKRNRAAHSDSYVISSIDELDYIKELFEKLIWNLSIKTRSKWKIKSEIIEIIKSQKTLKVTNS